MKRRDRAGFVSFTDYPTRCGPLSASITESTSRSEKRSNLARILGLSIQFRSYLSLTRTVKMGNVNIGKQNKIEKLTLNHAYRGNYVEVEGDIGLGRGDARP